MRYAAILVVVAGCRCGSSAPAIDEAAWKPIAELARPRVPAGPSGELTNAMAIAERRSDAWRSARTPADRLEGEEAVALLVQWSRGGGGLPALEPRTVMWCYALGELAVDSATESASDGVAAASYLGNRLVTEGRTLLEATVGVAVLHHAIDKAKALGEPLAGWPVPADGELVRIVAAEAMYLHDRLTPEGRAAIDAELAKHPVGKIPLGIAMESSGDDLAKLWTAALADARSGEPDRVLLDRVKKHATTGSATRMLAAVERIAGELEALRAATR